MPHNGHASQSFAGNPGSDLRHCIGAVHALQLRAAPEGHCQQTESPVADLQAPHRRQSDLSWNSGTARTQQTVLRNTLASTPGHIHGSGRAHGRHIRIGQPSEPKCAWATQGDGTTIASRRRALRHRRRSLLPWHRRRSAYVYSFPSPRGLWLPPRPRARVSEREESA